VQGGYVEIQYQLAGASGWTAWGQCNPSVNSLFITGVNVGSQYNVQIRAVNCAGVPSPWVQAGPETISAVVSPFTYNGVPVAPTGTLTAQSTAGGTQMTVNAFTPFVYPQLCVASPAILTGLNPSQLYFVYYVDTAMAGGTITPIATQNESNFLNLPGYFLIGSLVTPAASTRYQPSSYADQGTFASVTPTAAYDNNTNTAAVVSGGYWNYGVAPMPVGGDYYFTSGQGQCSFLNFPAITTTVGAFALRKRVIAHLQTRSTACHRISSLLDRDRDYGGLRSVVEVSTEITGMPRFLAGNWQAIFEAARPQRLSNANGPIPGVLHESVLVSANLPVREVERSGDRCFPVGHNFNLRAQLYIEGIEQPNRPLERYAKILVPLIPGYLGFVHIESLRQVSL
jgi:hypothetical protein